MPGGACMPKNTEKLKVEPPHFLKKKVIVLAGNFYRI
jgi:hypothetical protein